MLILQQSSTVDRGSRYLICLSLPLHLTETPDLRPQPRVLQPPLPPDLYDAISSICFAPEDTSLNASLTDAPGAGSNLDVVPPKHCLKKRGEDLQTKCLLKLYGLKVMQMEMKGRS